MELKNLPDVHCRFKEVLKFFATVAKIVHDFLRKSVLCGYLTLILSNLWCISDWRASSLNLS